MLELPKVDGRELKIVAVSPLLRAQDQQDVSDFMRFQQSVAQTFGPEIGPALYEQQATINFLADRFGIDASLLADEKKVAQNVSNMMSLMQQQQQGNI